MVPAVGRRGSPATQIRGGAIMDRQATSRMQPTTIVWPDTIDELFAGDCVVMLAYVTPASGVVLTPFTNFAVRDRAAGTLTSLNSSVGVWKKLERMRRNPGVALAFHTREYGSSHRPEYVLVEGTASLSSPIPRLRS